MMAVRLFMVEASDSDFDKFDCAVVYATGADDAIKIVRAEIDKRITEETAAGAWYELDYGVHLTATPVPHKRGAVLGCGRAG